MANWEAIAGGFVFGKVFEPLEGIASGLQSILAPINTILGVLRSILKIIRVFLIETTSIILALVKTIVKQITDFIRSIANAGIYWLLIAPDSRTARSFFETGRGGFDGFVNKIANSLEDSADQLRPNFDTSQQVGGIALAVSSGNIMQALNFLSLISQAFARTFDKMYPPLGIVGFSGNSANVIQFKRPSLPTTFFTNVKFILERSTQSGGEEQSFSAQRSAVNNTVGADLTETRVDDQRNSQTITKWTEVKTVSYNNQFTAPEQIIFIDQNQSSTAPHLIRFDLSNQAQSQAVFTDGVNRSALQRVGGGLGPKTFSMFSTNIAGFPLVTPKIALLSEIETTIPQSSMSDTFKKKIMSLDVGTPTVSTTSSVSSVDIKKAYIDFRINGISIPYFMDDPTSDYKITSVSSTQVTLNKSVPLGATVELYTYVMVSSAEIITLREFNAGHPSLYTSIEINNNTGSSQKPLIKNGQQYFYRLRIEADGYTTDGINGGVSNEIRLVPKQAFAPNPTPAFCMSGKQGPFVILPGQNILHFELAGGKKYAVSLPISKQNIFSKTASEFNDNFGLIISDKFSGSATTQLLSDTLESAIEKSRRGVNGLTFDFVDGAGNRVLVLPGDYIPIDIEEVISEIQAQTNDPNIIIRSHNSRILIQDGSSSVTGSMVKFLRDCPSLGFSAGICMNVVKSTPPDWERVAVKDLVPQITQVADLIDAFTNKMLSSAESAVKAIVDFIDLLDAKIKSIQDFITRINDLLEFIKKLKIELPNMYKLEIPLQNGTAGLKSFIESAVRPTTSANDYTVGVVLVAGGAGSGTIVSFLHELI